MSDFDADGDFAREPSQAEEAAADDADQLVEGDLDELGRLALERDEYRELAQRIQADFENYKKRALKLQTEHLERAAQALVVKLLPVLDTFDLALAHGAEELRPVHRALTGVLEAEGLERLDPQGKPFDPNEHDAVGDPEKRKQYDEMRRLGPMGFTPGGGGFTGAPGAEGFTFVGDLGDLGDLFGGLFGRGRAGRGRGAGPARGDNLETELHLSFLDAVNGVTTTVHVTSEPTCSRCHGTGAAPGTSPIVCPRCAGRGTVEENQGPLSFSQPCPQCGGRGMVVEKACPTCRGSGVTVQPRQVKVRVPAGVEDAQRIRLKGRGGPGRNGGPPGDLYVVVRVGSHALFGRR